MGVVGTPAESGFICGHHFLNLFVLDPSSFICETKRIRFGPPGAELSFRIPIDSMADFLTGLGINSGTAAVGILGHSLLLKMLTTVQFRAKLTMDPKTPQVSQDL